MESQACNSTFFQQTYVRAAVEHIIKLVLVLWKRDASARQRENRISDAVSDAVKNNLKKKVLHSGCGFYSRNSTFTPDMKKHIPNTLTCLNLLCGCWGIIFIFEDKLEYGGYFILLAAVFDFLDGFSARMLKAYSEIGKQLDSLADLVSFGLLPGLIVFKLLTPNMPELGPQDTVAWHAYINIMRWRHIALLIPVFSALRLAKFNIDTRQSESFLGVPTPATAILFGSFPLIIRAHKMAFVFYAQELFTNIYFLGTLTIVMCLLMVSELPLISFKFKNFSWKGNEVRYILLLLSMAAIPIFQFLAIPIIILLYILISIVNTYLIKR